MIEYRQRSAYHVRAIQLTPGNIEEILALPEVSAINVSQSPDNNTIQGTLTISTTGQKHNFGNDDWLVKHPDYQGTPWYEIIPDDLFNTRFRPN